VLQVAQPGPVSLIATYPMPRPPPPGMALERPAPPPVPVAVEPVGDGPFRTMGRVRVERQPGGLVRIQVPNPSRTLGFALFALVPFVLMALLAGAGVSTVAIVAALGLIGGVALTRGQTWRLELGATSIAMGLERGLPVRVDRAGITHIRCVCPNPTGVGPPNVPWEIWVTVDGVQTPLARFPNLDQATTVAELLVHELGLPTWVPVPRLAAPR